MFRHYRIASIAEALLLLFASTHPASSQTNVSGTVSGNWTLAGSPYIVTGNLSMINLAIDAGVRVEVNGNYLIDVLALVTANGTNSNPILFTSSTADWNGIQFLNTPPNTFLKYCIIENTDEPALKILDSLPALTGCTVRNCNTTVPGPAVTADVAVGNLIFKACTFRDNTSTTHGGGLRINMGGGFTCVLQECLIENNAANPAMVNGSYRAGGIYFTAEDGSLVISDSEVVSNTAYGRCSSTGCRVDSWGGGLYSTGGDVRIVASRFINNRVQPIDDSLGGFEDNYGWGGAVYFEGASNLLDVRNAEFACNTSYLGGTDPRGFGGAIYVQSGSACILNSTFSENATESVAVVGRADAINANTGSVLNIRNCILYWNNLIPSMPMLPPTYGAQVQGGGSITLNYSDVQGGWAGMGANNIAAAPLFMNHNCDNLGSVDLSLFSISPCIDSGDPDVAYNDLCFSPSGPSQGTARNDIGRTGGPQACPGSSAAIVMTRTDGLNEMTYTAMEARVGHNWSATINCPTATVYSLAALYGYTAPADIMLNNGYAVLMDLSSIRVLHLGAMACPGMINIAIPPDPSLVGCAVYTQALHFGGAPGFALSASQDLIIGR